MGFADNFRLFLDWLKWERGWYFARVALFGAIRFLAAAGLVWLLAIVLGAPPLPARPLLLAALIADTRERTGALKVGPAIAPPGLRAWTGGLAAVLAVTAALLALSPGRFGASARRLLHPGEAAPAFGMEVTPGNVTVKPGD